MKNKNVIYKPSAEIQKVLGILGTSFPGLLVTSLNDDASDRVKNSKHGSGNAVDISMNNTAGQDLYKFITTDNAAKQWTIDNNIQVIIHKTDTSVKHIHIEKESKNPGIIIK